MKFKNLLRILKVKIICWGPWTRDQNIIGTKYNNYPK